MSTITPHYRTVQQPLQSQSFSIDEYQREYKWEKDNVDELVTDLHEKFHSCYKDGSDHESQHVRGLFPWVNHRQQARQQELSRLMDSSASRL